MRRWLFVGIGILVLLAGSGLIAYRVLAPHETLTPPTAAYPEVEVIADERPYSELRAAPLVIEGRLRAYAEKYRVWTDSPVGYRYEATPYWVFRRWPAQVVGLVTAQSRTGTLVISQWSDGALIAIDARRGAIAWRTTAPIGEREYDGRRTGASIVYEPRSLLTVRATDRTVLLVTGPKRLTAIDVNNGQDIWRRDLPVGCEPLGWTGAGLLALPDCDGAPRVTLVKASDGIELGGFTSPEPTVLPKPALCELGRTECRLVTVGPHTWLLGADGSLDAVPTLESGAQLAGERVIYQTGVGVAARRLTDVTPLWTWSGKGKLIGADSAGVYLLTDDRTVLQLSPATGHLSAIGCASSAPNERWQVGHVYPTGGTYLAMERITNAGPETEDQQYYYSPRPVALVELYPPTKLPVWPGKFAACRPNSS